MRKENLKRKGEDDAENGSDSGEQENSPAAADKEEDAEMQSANENTEENGDSKEPGTDDDFEDAETGDDKDAKKSDKGEENGNEEGKEEGEAKDDEDDDMDDVPLKKSGRAKPKPAKKGAKETNGDSKANGDDKGDGEEGDKEEAGEDGEDNEVEDDAGGEKDDEADSDYESGSKKAKKGGAAGKKAAPKKKEVKKTKPKPAKKTKKEEIEEEDAEEEEYEVQDIVDHRKERGKMVFRIRWKNYGAKDDTWEPEATLSCPDIIKRYKAKLKKEEEKEQEEEEEAEYEVQDIVDHRKEKGKMVYRIRWKNFGAKDDTWEPEATLSCPEIIKRYKAKLKKEEEKEEEEEEEAEYEVQDIIDHRKEKGKMIYRIRWKNFGPKDDTWEPEATLSCPEIIKRYKAKIEKEDSAPPAKKAKAGPKGAPAKGATPKAPPKKRAVKEDSEDDEDGEEDDTEYEVEKIIEVHFKRNGQRDYLVRWKGFTAKDDTWEPEEHLHCKDLIAKFNEKLDKSKNAVVKELRVNRKQPERLNLVERGHKTSKRNAGKVRVNYYDGE